MKKRMNYDGAEIELSLDWDEVFSDSTAEPITTSGDIAIADALVMSLNRSAKVDIEYISRITGADMKTVISVLTESDTVFQNPLKWNECYYLGFETADEYLSGNILSKIKIAKEANEKYDGYFTRNITALKKVLPAKSRAEDIYATLGSPWLPAEVIDDFIVHLFGRPSTLFNKEHLKTKHDVLTGSWEIPLKGRYDYSKSKLLVHFTYGTRFMSAMEIIEKTLNQKIPTVYDTKTTYSGGKSKKVRILNETESMLAQEKQKIILEDFSSWIFSSPTRKKRLEDIYNERYGCVKVRHYNGDFLEFPDLAPGINLYPYQKNAIARILFSKSTLLAHDVGAGKTFIMVAAGHEMRRMGTSNKNLYVVPNSLTGQWKDSYLQLYPDAKLLVVNPPKFTPKQRQATLREMRDGDYEAIIIAYSCFDMIPLSNAYLTERLEEEKMLLEEADSERQTSTAALKHRKRTVEEAIKKIQLTEDKLSEAGITFEELKVGAFFLDEGHNYKNIKIDTKMQILGVSESGSTKCEAMLAKVHCVSKNGGSVIFATGTPITNSVSDVYTMQRYLQNSELTLLDLQSFDSWCGMFAEKRTEFEVDVDTSSFRMATRLSRFFNLPELTTLFSGITDFHKVDKTNEIPDFSGYTDVVIPKTVEFQSYLDKISERADDVRHRRVSRKVDNLLLITTDGRKAALDIRLVNPSMHFTTQSKVYSCAEAVYKIYTRTKSDSCAQLVFCDTSTPKDGFNIYDDLKGILKIMGIPEEEIAFIHTADTESRRRKLFAEVNAGRIRVLIGSTFKLGMGVNVQERLVALHHLDVPWRPADMVQREGRILRQGNTCPEVEIYRYITEGSFDAYSWQLLETKQKFIEDLLSGFVEDKFAEDISDTSLNYGEVKALAVGNPLIKERIECSNMLGRFKILMIKDLENRDSLKSELTALPKQKEKQSALIAACQSDIEYTEANPDTYTEEDKLLLRTRLQERLLTGEFRINEECLLEYRGFRVILPSGLIKSYSPYIFLEREGRYYVELGAGVGSFVLKIDAYIDAMSDQLKKLNDGLKFLKNREKSIKTELKKENDYSDRVAYYRDKLAELDKKLGVK